MQVRQIMTRDAAFVTPDVSVRYVAMKMRELAIGAMPVVQADHIVGIVTDRDLAVRFLPDLASAGGEPVSGIMSVGVRCCYHDQEVEEVVGIMGDHQIRRLPVLDRDDRLVGIISVGDIAKEVSETLAGEALGEIVEQR